MEENFAPKFARQKPQDARPLSMACGLISVVTAAAVAGCGGGGGGGSSSSSGQSAGFSLQVTGSSTTNYSFTSSSESEWAATNVSNTALLDIGLFPTGKSSGPEIEIVAPNSTGTTNFGGSPEPAIAYYPSLSDTSTVYATVYSPGTGQITITSANGTTVSGSFSATVYNATGSASYTVSGSFTATASGRAETVGSLGTAMTGHIDSLKVIPAGT